MGRREFPKVVLELRLDAASTPERVVAAAQMFRDALKAADPAMDPDSVTMVVSNYSMHVELRAQDTPGKNALGDISSVAANPLRAIERRPTLQLVARAFAAHAPALVQHHAEITKPEAKRPVARINDNFARVMAAAAHAPTASHGTLRGPTTVYSPILRVGRTAEGRDLTVRLLLDAAPYELQLSEGAAIDDFWEAARHGRVAMVQLEAEWLRDADGRYRFDPTRTTATSVEAYEPIPGSLLVEELRGAAPSLAKVNLDDVDG